MVAAPIGFSCAEVDWPSDFVIDSHHFVISAIAEVDSSHAEVVCLRYRLDFPAVKLFSRATVEPTPPPKLIRPLPKSIAAPAKWIGPTPT